MAPLIAQLAWSAIGGAVGAFFRYAGRLDMAAGFLVASAVYAALPFAAFRGRRWAWWLVLIPAVFFVLCVGPWSAYNFYAFLTDHPKYIDSPGTILIVAANSVVLLLPAIAVLILMVAYRKRPNSTVHRTSATAALAGDCER